MIMYRIRKKRANWCWKLETANADIAYELKSRLGKKYIIELRRLEDDRQTTKDSGLA